MKRPVDINKASFRVECVLCNHGTPMTIEEINRSLLYNGRPYIVLGYCKYCCTENAVGLFCDEPEMLGYGLGMPQDSDDGLFHLEVIPMREASEMLKLASEMASVTLGRRKQDTRVTRGQLGASHGV